jgi:hypothetical protein
MVKARAEPGGEEAEEMTDKQSQVPLSTVASFAEHLTEMLADLCDVPEFKKRHGASLIRLRANGILGQRYHAFGFLIFSHAFDGPGLVRRGNISSPSPSVCFDIFECRTGHLFPQKFRELKVPVPEPRLADGR